MLVDGSKITTSVPFLLKTNSDASPVTVDFTYPDGVSYDSSTPSGGTFNGTTWTVPTLLAVAPQTLYITVTVDSVANFLAGDRTIIGVANYSGEIITSNNTSTRVLGTEPDDAEPPVNCCVDYQAVVVQDTKIKLSGIPIYREWRNLSSGTGSPQDTGISYGGGKTLLDWRITYFTGLDDQYHINDVTLSRANTLSLGNFEVTLPVAAAQGQITIWYTIQL